MRPAQKNAVWMIGIVQKFRKPGNLVVDTCAGTSSVAKAFIFLDKQRRPIGVEVDLSCATETMSQLILLYAREVLRAESDSDGE